MSAEFQLPDDPGELQAWLDNFAEQLPKYAEQLGITPEELAQVKEFQQSHRRDVHQAVTEALAIQRQRLVAACPDETRWPSVFKDGWTRLPVSREPERSQAARLLAQWITGIERAYAGPVRPVLTGGHFAEGIELRFDLPKPCDSTAVYYRLKGRAKWEFLLRYTHPGIKRLYTTPEYLDEEEKKLWPGRTLEFVAVGWFEEAAFGFPCEPVAVAVPSAKA